MGKMHSLSQDAGGQGLGKQRSVTLWRGFQTWEWQRWGIGYDLWLPSGSGNLTVERVYRHTHTCTHTCTHTYTHTLQAGTAQVSRTSAQGRRLFCSWQGPLLHTTSTQRPRILSCLASTTGASSPGGSHYRPRTLLSIFRVITLLIQPTMFPFYR